MPLTNSHIDDIIGLIDKVLGPDEGNPVPALSDLGGYAIPARVMPNRTRRLAPSCIPPYPSRPRPGPREWVPSGQQLTDAAEVRGPFTVRQLHRLTLDYLNKEFLGRRPVRALTNNTKLIRMDRGTLGVVFHQTVIMTVAPFSIYDDDDTGRVKITLDSGGYRTVTTKQRMNSLLPDGYGLYSKKGKWVLFTPAGEFGYEDGTTITIG